MSIADVNSAMSAAVAALRAGDYATALTESLAAQGLINCLPSASRSGGQLESELRYSAADIDAFVSRVERMKNQAAAAAGGGMSHTPVTYERG
ncbi:MAG: hypothetical protein IMZ55_02395 [Acidobacteria bacterium]|nr:hypothetical protein [Acidobacteriota bacterium]